MKKLVLTVFLFLGGLENGRAEVSLDQWIQNQKPKAAQRMKNAISPKDGAPGSVFASPSRYEPDYYYHWVRDAALVMREVYEMRGEQRAQADRMLRDFADFSRRNQMTHNPSGGPGTGGLGEPKFHMDGSAYEDSWGRPQNDGPALRAILFARYAMDLWSEGDHNYVKQKLYRPELPANTVLKADLEYVAHHWRQASFDLWEESAGDHFYTRYSQWQAMEEGSKLARVLGDHEAANYYAGQAQVIRRSLENFWSGSQRMFRVTVRNTEGINYKNSGVDVANVLIVNQVGPKSGPFSVRDERILQTAIAVEEHFKGLYAINRVTHSSRGEELGTAVGRYPEDRYNGYRTDREGNPWFLATHGMAEFYYRLAREVVRDPGFIESSHYRPYLAALTKSSIRVHSSAETLAQRLFERGDSFLRRAQYHTASGGHQSEQFSRDDGTMQGAEDLTWSYASFLSATRARADLVKAMNSRKIPAHSARP